MAKFQEVVPVFSSRILIDVLSTSSFFSFKYQALGKKIKFYFGIVR